MFGLVTKKTLKAEVQSLIDVLNSQEERIRSLEKFEDKAESKLKVLEMRISKLTRKSIKVQSNDKPQAVKVKRQNRGEDSKLPKYVTLEVRHGKKLYRGAFQSQGKRYWIGRFNDPISASRAVKAKRRELGLSV